MEDNILTVVMSDKSDEARFMQALTYLERALNIVGNNLVSEDFVSWETVQLIAEAKQQLVDEYADFQRHESLEFWDKKADTKGKES